MKKYLVISLLMLVFLVTVVSAATTDFVANGDITINSVTHPGGGSPTANLTIVSGSRAESWSYNSGNFSVTNPDATNLFTVSASGVSSVRVNNSASQEVACGTGSVQLPSTAGLYRVYASDSSCAGSSSSSSAGGSSGGGSTPPPAPILPAPPAAVPPPPAGGPPAPFVAQPSPVAQIVSPVFNRTLRLGARGEDVKRLQQFLNSDLETLVTETGNGSPGQETDFFGNLTKQAVGKFQLKYGVIAGENDEGYGIVGPRTRAKLAEVFSGQPAAAPIAESQTVAVLQAELRQLLEQLVILLQAQLQSLTFQ